MAIFSISFILLAAAVGYALYQNRHPPIEFTEIRWNKKEVLFFLYPGIFRLLYPFMKKQKVLRKGSRQECLRKIYTGFRDHEIYWFYYCKLGSLMLVAIWCVVLLLFVSSMTVNRNNLLQQCYFLLREEPGGEEQTVVLDAQSKSERSRIHVAVPVREYSPEERKAKFGQAGEYIRRNYLGENTDSQKILSRLNLINSIPGNEVRARWNTDANGYVQINGELCNENLTEPVQVKITAVLCYREYKEKIPLEIMIHPGEKNSSDAFWETWRKKAGDLAEQTTGKEVLPLPERIGEEVMQYREVKERNWVWIMLLGIVVCFFLPGMLDYRMTQKIQEKERGLLQEYPELVDRFILLIGAGLTMKGSWYRMTEDYIQRRKNNKLPVNYLYEEMLVTRREMENGSQEAAAYEGFSRRISLLAYMKFTTLLVQNLKKGSRDLLERMELEAADTFQQRRENAKTLGEEASTRLIFPMMLMLIIVFGMILAAAFQNL